MAVALGAAAAGAVEPIVIEPVVPLDPKPEEQRLAPPPQPQPAKRGRLFITPLWQKIARREKSQVRASAPTPAVRTPQLRDRKDTRDTQRRLEDAEEEIRQLQQTIRDLHKLQIEYEEQLAAAQEQPQLVVTAKEPDPAIEILRQENVGQERRLRVYEDEIRDLRAALDEARDEARQARLLATAPRPEPEPAGPDLSAEVSRLETSLAEAEERAAGLNIAVERMEQERETQRVLLIQRDGEIEDLKKSIETLRQAAAPAEPAPTDPGGRIAELEALLLQADRRALRLEKQLSDLRAGSVPAEDPPAPTALESLDDTTWILTGETDPTLPPIEDEPLVPGLTLTPAEQVEEANRLLNEGEVAEAERLFEEAARADGSLLSASFGLAACRYACDDLRGASRLAEQVLQRDPSYARALGLKGIIAWHDGDLKAALNCLERAVRLAPGDAHLHNYLGIAHHTRNAHSASVRSFRRAIELDPMNAEAQFNLAVVLATSDRPLLDEARASYEAALQLGNRRDAELEEILYP